MYRILLVLITLFLIGTINTSGQNPQNQPYPGEGLYKHYFGINAGLTTGVGFSYRYWPGKNGFQVTFLPVVDRTSTTISFGATYLKEIKTFDKYRFLVYASNHLTNLYQYHDQYIDNIGIGAGFDVYQKYFVLNMMVGYGCIDVFQDFRTRPTFEMGLFYNF